MCEVLEGKGKAFQSVFGSSYGHDFSLDVYVEKMKEVNRKIKQKETYGSLIELMTLCIYILPLLSLNHKPLCVINMPNCSNIIQER